MGKIPVSSPVKAGGPPGACRLPFLPNLNGTLPLSKGPQTPSVIYLSLASSMFDSHSVSELCLVDGAEQADPDRPERRLKMQPPVGTAAPFQPRGWMSSHMAMRGKESDPRTGGNPQTRLGHSPPGAPVPAGEWGLLHLPFLPPSAVESMPGEKVWEVSPPLSPLSLPKEKDPRTKLAETRVQILT